MKNLVIIGAGDLGKEVAWLIEDINQVEPTYVILGFLDDNKSKLEKEFFGYKVLGGAERLDELSKEKPLAAVLAVQDGTVRKQIVEAHPAFTSWETIVHPSAVVAASSTVGAGSILFPHVTVSVEAELGRFGLYYIHSTVCNNCRIGDYVSVMSGAAILEHSCIGEECFLSASSCVYPYVKLGKRSRMAVEGTVKTDCGENSRIEETGSGKCADISQESQPEE